MRSRRRPTAMEEPYLLRRRAFFNGFTQSICNRAWFNDLDGIKAPAIPVLKAIPLLSGLTECFRSRLQPTVTKPLAGMALKARQYMAKGRHIYRQRKRSPSPLLDLPVELVLLIMSHLPAPSLYCLRQTSTTCMRLFEAQQFEQFARDAGSFRDSMGSTRYLGFNLNMLGAANKNAVANSLYHNLYCGDCLAAEERGTLANRLQALRSLQHCDGCNRPHASALFFPEDIKRNSNQPGELCCMGRLGHVTLCDHDSTVPITWLNIQERVQRNWRYESACTNQSHQPSWEHNNRLWGCGSPFPRLVAVTRRDLPSVFELEYGWDLPLLTYDTMYYTPTLAAIKDTLSKIVTGASYNHRFCPHISADEEIQDFIQSGICKCFRRWTHIDMYDPFQECACGRQITLECQICGAVYMWLSCYKQVVLSCRYLWRVQKPTSPGWISLLDKQFREKFFTQENQHVLWCNTPSCRTNKRGRWEALVKEDSEREYIDAPDSVDDCWDYVEGKIASEEGSYQNW